MAKYVNEANLARFWDNIQDQIGSASQEQVDAWLDEHPEATTTVQDNSVTDAKLVQDGGVLDAVAGLDASVNRLNDISYAVENDFMPVNWFERGSITSGNNDSYRSGSRMRTINILQFDTPVMITGVTGQFVVTYYSSSDVYNTNSGWKSAGDVVLIAAGQKFRIMLTLNNGAPASQVDALSDMVKCVTFKVDGAHKPVKNIFNMEFERGALLSGANDTYNGNARARSTSILQFPFAISVSMASGSYGVHLLDDSGVFLTNTAWRQTEKYNIGANQKFRLVLTNNPTSSQAADLQELVDNLVVEPANSSGVIGLSPNIIFQCRNVDDTAFPPESKWYVQAAAKNQYDRVRFTVRKTTDGYYFNCHDDYINNVARNTDGSAISDTVYANNQTLAALNQYDWGIKYGAKYAGATVPLLEDTLKFAALFNLGVTWHSATSLVESDADIAAQIELIDKYGLTDNLIVITASGCNFAVMQKFLAHNPRISYYVLGTETWFNNASNIDSIEALKTAYNKIYVQLAPWGTESTGTFIALAKSHNWCLYNSIAMSSTDLLSVNTFSEGYSLIEANNVYAIKDAVRNWANGLIDA